jgi:Cu-processing system permease protein
MSVAPSTIGKGPLPARSDRVAVPSSWRSAQVALTVAVALLAIYYALIGYKSAPGESGLADKVSLFDLLGFGVLVALVWAVTPTTATIAMTTWQEAIRRRWMSALLAFAIVLMPISTFFTWMQQGEEEKFLRDFGVGFTVIITVLMAIFLGVALIPPDIERRTIFTILSKPVDRREFLLGKYLGLCLTLWVSLAVMALMFLLTFAWFSIRREGYADAMAVTAGHPGLAFEIGNLARALLLHGGALMIMAALALTLSLMLSNIAAVVFSFVVYFLGQGASYWEYLSRGGSGSVSSGIAGVIRGAYLFLPRLDRFDVRERLVNDMPVAFNYMWKALSGGLIYVAVLLLVAYYLFSDREF